MKNIKNKILTLSLAASFFATSASALTLDSAVELALEKNHDLQAQEYDYLESKQNIKLNDANFLPKLDLSYGYNKRDKVSQGSNKEDGTLGAKVSYNLFNGLKDISNKDSAKFLSNSSRFTLEALKQDTILNTKKAYINYLDKVHAQRTFESEYELFEKQFIDAKNRYDQGLMARNDLLQVQVNMSNAKQNVVRAKADVKIAKFELSNILGGMDLSSENIEDLKQKDLIKKDYDITLLDQRSEIKALKMNLESLRSQQKAARGSNLPKVDASLAHNRFYEDLSFNEIDSGVDNQNVASLNASWNLYNGGSDQTQIAIFNTRMAKLKSQLAKTSLDIKLQYENALSDFDVANDNYKTATLALEQAKENYNIVQNRFKEGISTSTDLTDANFLLTSAKQRYNRAYFDKYLSIATLNRVTENK